MSASHVKILIADDDPRVRQLLICCLSDFEAQFIECQSGTEAVGAFQQHQPDWAFMDLQMPGLDGLTATRRIIEAFPQARVLIVTQFESSQLREAALQAGARGYVLKDNLLGVREFLSRPASE